MKDNNAKKIEKFLLNKISKEEIFYSLKDQELDHRKLAELIFDFPIIKNEKEQCVFRVNYILFLFFLLVSCLAFVFALNGLLLKVLMIGIWGIWYELSKKLSGGMNSGFSSAILISVSIIVMFFLMIKFYEVRYFNNFYCFSGLITFFGAILLINTILSFKYHGLKFFQSGWAKKRNTPRF